MIPMFLAVAVHGGRDKELGERQAVSVEEAAMALGGSPPSTGECFPVFVQTTRAGSPLAVDAPVTGDLQDLVKQAQSQSIIPKFRSDEGVTVTVAGVPFAGSALLTPVSEAEVAAESVVEINVRKSDIQWLFEIFENPATTEALFGYPTYEQFRNSRPHSEAQPPGLTRCLQWNDHQRLVGVGLNPGPTCINEPSSINWDAVAQLTELTKLAVTRCEITGRLPLDILPRKLNVLNMNWNLLTGVENIYDSPPFLYLVNLEYNQFRGLGIDLQDEQVPRLFRECRQEGMWWWSTEMQRELFC